MGDCNVYADVDFGHGTVEIRCTMRGSHTHHRCLVEIGPADVETPASPPEGEVGRHNVFER